MIGKLIAFALRPVTRELRLMEADLARTCKNWHASLDEAASREPVGRAS